MTRSRYCDLEWTPFHHRFQCKRCRKTTPMMRDMLCSATGDDWSLPCPTCWNAKTRNPRVFCQLCGGTKRMSPEAARNVFSKSPPLAGIKICLTGTLNSFKRDVARRRILGRGGIFQRDVTKTTNYLVKARGYSTQKVMKAKDFDVTVIDEDEFLEIVEYGPAFTL